MSNESKYHAVNYSILMGLLNYSQSRLEKLQDKLDRLVFIDHLVDASLLRDILQVSNSEIQATALAAKAAIDNLELDDVNVISIKDELYPQLLKQVRRPPGEGNNPDALRTVHVRPTIVRRDRLPLEDGLPGGRMKGE